MRRSGSKYSRPGTAPHHQRNQIDVWRFPFPGADNAQQSDGRAATAGGRRTATEFLLPFAVNTERSNGTTLWIEHGFIILKDSVLALIMLKRLISASECVATRICWSGKKLPKNAPPMEAS